MLKDLKCLDAPDKLGRNAEERQIRPPASRAKKPRYTSHELGQRGVLGLRSS